jgi:hypothetical protein
MANVPIDRLAEAIADAFREYTEDVSNAIDRKVDETADKVLNAVVTDAPKRSGKYAKGFRKTKQDNPGRTKRVIWNKKDYRRVHVLEFGHAKRGGGRVRAFPHLRPAYDKYGADLPEDIKRIIRNGGGT